jgi:23S rRNA (adenine1618-N6)-methyltransferase
MATKKAAAEKTGLHPRNKHRGRYNFTELMAADPALKPFVRRNEYHDESIDFANADAVLHLNKALLKHFYGIRHWSIPPGYLCPPIPGRADYLHHIADLLASTNHEVVPRGQTIKCLDIGVGANCIYPIVGITEYGWTFVGSDIDATALASANKIIGANGAMKGKAVLRLQPNSKDIFRGIVHAGEHFDVTICNPPFHASPEEARSATLRKVSNLNHRRITKAELNFGGKNNELWCDGGEEKFIQKMIIQSKTFASSVFWFSTLVSQSSHLKSIYAALKNAKATNVKTIAMSQGNKTSRIVTWTYLTPEQQKTWIRTRWANR